MTTPATTRAPRRVPLSRERVLDAAIKLADQGGLESLSMRKLGQELGVEAMAVYYHFANKDEVIDGIVDIVFSEIDLPASGPDWKTAMRRRAVSLRDVLLREPSVLPRAGNGLAYRFADIQYVCGFSAVRRGVE